MSVPPSPAATCCSCGCSTSSVTTWLPSSSAGGVTPPTWLEDRRRWPCCCCFICTMYAGLWQRACSFPSALSQSAASEADSPQWRTAQSPATGASRWPPGAPSSGDCIPRTAPASGRGAGGPPPPRPTTAPTPWATTAAVRRSSPRAGTPPSTPRSCSTLYCLYLGTGYPLSQEIKTTPTSLMGWNMISVMNCMAMCQQLVQGSTHYGDDELRRLHVLTAPLDLPPPVRASSEASL
jgi:hypothetical protein